MTPASSSAALILALVGMLINLAGLAGVVIMQVWVQPRWFREDSQRQAKLITDRFDAQLQALEAVSERAAETVRKAAKFFQDAEHQIADHESRLKELEHIMREEASLRRRVVEELQDAKERLATVEGVCRGRHGESIQSFVDRRRQERGDDGVEDEGDTRGVPQKRGC